jgi:hypothetical protein
MKERLFPYAVFLGCIMFSVLHALTYRLEQKAVHETRTQSAPATTNAAPAYSD